MTVFLNEAGAAQAQMLSPHFSRAELEHSDTAIAHGIPNLMGPDELRAAAAWCINIGEPIRQHFGVPVKLNSFYRCPKVNALVGSRPGSQHERGEAGDIELPPISNVDVARWIASSTLNFDQLILEAYHQGQPSSGWVHVSHRLVGNGRRQVLTMVMAAHGPVYLPGLQP